MTDDIARRVRAIIAGTFNISEDEIADETVADDIDGWDSLAHTVLMVRLQTHLGLVIPEAVAGNVRTVGELTAALRRLGAGARS